MDIFINPDSSVGPASQIYEEIRGGILEGRLGFGDRLLRAGSSPPRWVSPVTPSPRRPGESRGVV
jgi:hypothetical protein